MPVYTLVMSTQKYTPGPWYINTLEVVPHTIHACRGHVATVSHGTMLELKPDEIEANARLIACAPTMADLLAEISITLECPENGTDHLRDSIEKLLRRSGFHP